MSTNFLEAHQAFGIAMKVSQNLVSARTRA